MADILVNTWEGCLVIAIIKPLVLQFFIILMESTWFSFKGMVSSILCLLSYTGIVTVTKLLSSQWKNEKVLTMLYLGRNCFYPFLVRAILWHKLKTYGLSYCLIFCGQVKGTWLVLERWHQQMGCAGKFFISCPSTQWPTANWLKIYQKT